jgi:hypothetical protein
VWCALSCPLREGVWYVLSTLWDVVVSTVICTHRGVMRAHSDEVCYVWSKWRVLRCYACCRVCKENVSDFLLLSWDGPTSTVIRTPWGVTRASSDEVWDAWFVLCVSRCCACCSVCFEKVHEFMFTSWNGLVSTVICTP